MAKAILIITSFKPDHPVRRRKLIKNSFTPALQSNAPAQLEMVRLALDKDYFPFGVDTSLGRYSWDLPEDKKSKQKPCNFEVFDPRLIIIFPAWRSCSPDDFLGSSSDGRQTPNALRRRNKKADARGWTHERRQRTKQWSTSQSSTSQWSSSEWSSSEWNGAWSSSEWHGAWHSSESPTHGGGDQLVRD